MEGNGGFEPLFGVKLRDLGMETGTLGPFWGETVGSGGGSGGFGPVLG